MGNKLILIGLLSCFITISKAQNSETDSLKRSLSVATEDTSRILILEGLSYAYQYAYPDTALHYATIGLQLAQQISFKKGEAYCINALGNIYFVTANYPRALEMYLKALKIREQINDQRGIAVSNANIGNVYAEQRDYQLALTYKLKTIDADLKMKDSVGLLIDFFNIGSIYFSANKKDSSLYYEKKALLIATLLEDKDYIGAIMNQFGLIYADKSFLQNLPLALTYYHKAIYYADQINDHEVVSSAYYGIAGIFKELGNSDSSVYYSKKALQTAQETSFNKQILSASLLLSGLYEAEGMLDSAFKYEKLSMSIKDSVFNVERASQIQNLAFTEKLRQEEITEQKEQQKKERRDSLQLSAIAIFITTFFLIIVILGKKKQHHRILDFLAVLALLLLFEFISFLIHPYIGRLTHHTPVFYLLASVILASILAPIHHHTTKLIKVKVLKKE